MRGMKRLKQLATVLQAAFVIAFFLALIFVLYTMTPTP